MDWLIRVVLPGLAVFALAYFAMTYSGGMLLESRGKALASLFWLAMILVSAGCTTLAMLWLWSRRS